MSDRTATREAFNRALMAFITTLVRTRNKADAQTPIQVDEFTALFETGLIDSLGILELLAFVEENTGSPIPIQKVDLRFFGTVHRISRTFWRDAGEGAYGRAISTVGADENGA